MPAQGAQHSFSGRQARSTEHTDDRSTVQPIDRSTDRPTGTTPAHGAQQSEHLLGAS